MVGVAVLAAMMPFFSMTGLNVALAQLGSELDAPFATIQWVVTAYMLALAAMIPLAGWAAERFGLLRTHVVGLGVFIIGTLLCSASWSAGSLIFFRVLQGVGAGIVIPTVTTVINVEAGPYRRGRAIGLLGVPLLGIPIVGSVLAGWFVENLSWRWIFLVQVPVAALAIALALAAFDRAEPEPAHRPDWLGICLLPPGLLLLLFGLAESATAGLLATRAWLPIIAGAAFLIAFLVHSWRSRAALIDVKTFVHTKAGAAVGSRMLTATALFGGLFLLPLYYQAVRGASSFEAGLLVAPAGLGTLVALPVAGWFTDRHGPNWFPLLGIGFVVVGLLPFVFAGAQASLPVLCGFSFIFGVGDAVAVMPTSAAAIGAVPPAAIPRTSSAINVIDQVAGSVATATASVLLVGAMPAGLAAGGIGALVESARPGGGGGVALAGAFASGFGCMLLLAVASVIPALALGLGTPRLRLR